MLGLCHSIDCTNKTHDSSDFCLDCLQSLEVSSTPALIDQDQEVTHSSVLSESMSAKYPKYYKPVGPLTEVDVYAVHHLFNIQDPSGAIQHASKKLLLSGVRTGGKSAYDDIKEARDTLTRWMQLQELLNK